MSSLYQIFQEYILVYCTAKGLTALGEPTLASSSESIKEHVLASDRGKPPMPVWIVFIFVSLALVKWLISFLLDYIALLLSTVIAISSKPVHSIAAANARAQPLSQLKRLQDLVLRIRVVGAFKAARRRRLQSDPQRLEQSRRRSLVTVAETKTDLVRRSSLSRPITSPPRPNLLLRAWRVASSQPCFRGIIPLLTISIAQWLLAFITDFILSGHPLDHKLGYGTTSLLLRTIFAQAYAVWTHYCITQPSNKNILAHFPKGGEVLTELWPLTAVWSVAEHMCLSLPLALARNWGLRKWAFDTDSWNRAQDGEERLVLGQFAVVWGLHILLTAIAAVPATVITRRVYASMLSDEDLAIVPFKRGKKHRTLTFDERSQIKAPGLTAGEAWEDVSWTQYCMVLKVYLMGFLVNQAVQWAYWWTNWRLQEWFGVSGFAISRLPWSPIGVIEGFPKDMATFMEGKTEL